MIVKQQKRQKTRLDELKEKYSLRDKETKQEKIERLKRKFPELRDD